MNLKEQIIKANIAYRSGEPIISDEEYDSLLEKLEDEMGFIEFECFKQSLTEGIGKNKTVKHNYMIGSLTKIKAENPEDLVKFIEKEKITRLFVSEKLDGASITCFYKNGVLVSCASRGNGINGTCWLDKAKYFLPTTINYKEDLEIRGEVTLTGNDHEILGYKNKRSGVVGIMNNDSIIPDSLKYVKPLFYQILNSDDTIEKQFYKLIELGFNTPRFKILSIS